MSKLAALAAKRRQKENSRPSEAEGGEAATTDEYVSSLKALRLSNTASVKRRVADVQPGAGTSNVAEPTDLAADPSTQSRTETVNSAKAGLQFEAEDVIAQPSTFAKTIFGTASQA